MDYQLVGIGIATLLVILLAAVLWRRRTADRRASKNAHDAAQKRDAPVDLGQTYDLGVTEFTDHHSGERVAVGKVQGFVLFVHDVPDAVDEGDAIRATVTSFNRNNTSADAQYEGRA
ncbi:TRAM domain-containing protein [Halocalculus aciditolerans]|uniref:TRAM domain-containing protein n=1 Tax=Halocalculus aciditolerans TaxID=1383812 RepID=A0A830F795_9EURY|nr:hypothetical protein [Halocalculus aciditolerans]GGL70252.1 hypothetical protein GCM10009039_30380 [Halocalculus aciditolerans]